MQIKTKNISIDYSVRNLCRTPYPNHPKGCPNYGRKTLCPPKAALFEDVFVYPGEFWIVWIEFDFAAHCQKMRQKHPHWSQRQIECCLYWQNTANHMLKNEVEVLLGRMDDLQWQVTYCPEAMGVNVIETMRQLDIELEWPPVNIVRKIAVIGKKSQADPVRQAPAFLESVCFPE